MARVLKWIDCCESRLLSASILLLLHPAVAQEKTTSAPLTADEVMRRVVDMNQVRAKALENYSSIDDVQEKIRRRATNYVDERKARIGTIGLKLNRR